MQLKTLQRGECVGRSCASQHPASSPMSSVHLRICQLLHNSHSVLSIAPLYTVYTALCRSLLPYMWCVWLSSSILASCDVFCWFLSGSMDVPGSTEECSNFRVSVERGTDTHTTLEIFMYDQAFTRTHMTTHTCTDTPLSLTAPVCDVWSWPDEGRFRHSS